MESLGVDVDRWCKAAARGMREKACVCGCSWVEECRLVPKFLLFPTETCDSVCVRIRHAWLLQMRDAVSSRVMGATAFCDHV
jgi:hypothetical protein